MRFLLQVRLRLRSLLRRQQVEAELDEELQYHLEREIEENLAAGMPPDEARYAALRSLSNIEQRKEQCRDRRGVTAIENMAQDLRYGWRQLRRSPAFTIAAILSLGLGIGASVTMFSAFRAVFLRSLPYRDANRIVEIQKTAQHGYTPSLSAEDLQFLNRYAHTLQATATFGSFKAMTLSRISEPADWWVREVSAELFPLLGAKPLLGTGAGLLGAFALARLLAGLVYGVSARDPLSFGIAAVSLAMGALLAYYLPARRSTKLDPAAVLREE